jgi:hypothetical protein
MTSETLFTDDQPIRFKIIRPVYETLTVNDNAAQYFEPLEAIGKFVEGSEGCQNV